MAGETVGAMYFMAPEQEHGGQVDVDQRADLYALGKLLHWMLTGRYLAREPLDRAFDAGEFERAPRLREILEQILARTIVFDREARFPSVDALIRSSPATTRGKSALPCRKRLVPG